MKRSPRNPWLEMMIYLIVFAVLGTGLYLLKRYLKGPPRPRYVPIHELAK